MIAMVLKMAINLRSRESKRESIKFYTLIREVENPTLGRGCHIIGLVITPGLSVCGLRASTQEAEVGGGWGDKLV